MPKGIFMAHTNCSDPAREEEFNRWYSHTHLPDLSKSKGFVRARRFVGAAPGEPNHYLALYEFDTDDLGESVKDLLRLALAAFAAGRHIDCIARARTPTPSLLQEIDPATLAPLETLNYPTEVPEEMRRSIERMLAS
jgi:hypothetical protein